MSNPICDEAGRVIHANVRIGPEAVIGPFVVLGEPPRGARPGEIETVIGAGAIVRSHTVIYAGNVIGDGFQTGHGALVREYNTIGDDVSVGSTAVVEHHVMIGAGVRIHSGAFVPEETVLEAGAWIGPGAVLTNARYPRSRGVKDRLVGPRVRRGAKIGAGAVVLPAVELGEDCLIGAGAVVVSDVPPRAVAVGNPARIVRTIDEIPDPDGLLGPLYGAAEDA